MILKDILARELAEWPNGEPFFGQQSNGSLITCRDGVIRLTLITVTKAEDFETAWVSRAEWQAAVEALKADEQSALNLFYAIFPENKWHKADESFKDRIRAATKLPACAPVERAVEWDGVGLPPAGVICEHEAYEMRGESHRVEIIAHKQTSLDVAIFWDEEIRHVSYSSHHAFRPIRTQEQIAAEEREKAINEMILLDQKCSLSRTHFCGLLYDAKYRKQSQ